MPLGMGFILDEAQVQELLQRDLRNAEVIYPYLNGADLNREPDGSPSRYVINFHDWPLRRYSEEEWAALSEPRQNGIREAVKKQKSLILAPPDYSELVAADYPECLRILESIVKPKRLTDNRKSYRDFWWQYAEKRGGLYQAIAPLERVLVAPRVTKYLSQAFYLPKQVFSDQCTVFALEYAREFLVLQSTLHLEWAWKNSSTMGAGGLRYSPSNAFETFPFPQLTETQTNALEQLGEAYHQHRQQLCLALQLGLTKVYNLYHLPGMVPASGQPWGDPAEAAALAAQWEALDAKTLERQAGKEALQLLRHLSKIAGSNFTPRDPGAILRGAASPPLAGDTEGGQEPHSQNSPLATPETSSGEEAATVPAATLAEAIHGIWELRRLHVAMDEEVLEAYGWATASQGLSPSGGGRGRNETIPDPTYDQAITLGHAFHEVDYLPENDRIRFTLSPEARKEVLRRLLLLNHARYADEVRRGLHDKGKTKRRAAKPKASKSAPKAKGTGTLF